MIRLTQLERRFGPVHALRGIDLEVNKGQVLGLLGPNGAGKTTTIRIITAFLPPSAGKATVGGHDVVREPEAVRRLTGYLPESCPLYLEMRVDEYLHFVGRLMGMSRAERRQRLDALTEPCGLEWIRRRTIGKLSKGNRQRVGLAQALLHEPEVLVLDEPTSGLDPTQVRRLREQIDRLRERCTLVLCSHHLAEVERAADRVVILSQGQVLADGDPAALRDRASRGATLFAEVAASPKQVRAALDRIAGIDRLAFGRGEDDAAPTEPTRTQVRITPKGEQDLRAAVAEALASAGLPSLELRTDLNPLERLFHQAGQAPRASEGDEA